MIERLYRLITAWENLPQTRRRLIMLVSGALLLAVFVGYLVYASSRVAPAPVGSPTPAPTATSKPCRTGSLSEDAPDGDLCAYISGFVASPAGTDGVPVPVSGGLLYASLQSLDSGGLLPPQTLLTTSSDAKGAFSLPTGAAANWRILYGVQGQLGTPIAQTLITVVRFIGPNDFERDSFPTCGSATSENTDASFHLAGDSRLVMRITPCPDGTVLANVIQFPLRRAANATPSPTPAANPALVGVNDSTDLRYDPTLIDKTRIIQSGDAPIDPFVALVFIIGLLGVAAFGASAWWIVFSLRDLAHTELDEEED
jgi:hypothetical protein